MLPGWFQFHRILLAVQIYVKKIFPKIQKFNKNFVNLIFK